MIFALIALSTVFLASLCRDVLGAFCAGNGESEVVLSVNVTFGNEQEGVGANVPKGEDGGDIIRDVTPFYMVVYNNKGHLYGMYPVWGDGVTKHRDVSAVKLEQAYKYTPVNNEPYEGTKSALAGKIDYILKLKSGNYYIYAVANVENMAEQDIGTRDKLKAKCAETANYNRMLGIFSETPDICANDDTPLEISEDTSQLFCWARWLISRRRHG